MDLSLLTPQRLARTAGNVAFRGATVSPYARAAMGAYTYRKPLATAGKFVWKGVKSYKRKQQSRAAEIGFKGTIGSAKKDNIALPQAQGYPSRTLLSYDLTEILKTSVDIAGNLGATALEINRINRRQRQIIHYIGPIVNLL